MDDLVSLEPILRGAAFLAIVVLLTLAERARPRRSARPWRAVGTNIALFVSNTMVVRLLSGSSLVGLAIYAQAQGWGLINMFAFPQALAFLVAVVILDLVVYAQHRALHWVPWLWRLHAVHHADPAFDVTTGVRFHPGEIIVSLAIKGFAVVAIGAGPWATLVFEVLLSSASLFTHANLALPSGFESRLRWLLVTPEMHRVHHSEDPDEHNRNYGFLMSVWDRMFGSYRRSAALPQETMPIGLAEVAAADAGRLATMLALPFKSAVR